MKMNGILLLLLGLAQVTTAYYNPCYNYNTLSAVDRLITYTGQSPLRCDQRDINPGWYRFTGVSGNLKMPTNCPNKNRCGTHAPGWITGNHPSVADGVVTRTVCYHWSNTCCRWSNYIKVKNCGAFYVYELQKTPACYLRYCVEAPDPCSNYHYLYAANRLVTYTGQFPLRCDQRDINPGWYRFTGVSGNPKMPTNCPSKNRCGTHAPGWINGNHPSVADGEVTREVCYHWSYSCCRWRNYIKVKNCGAFYVYELQKTPTCSLRYCVAAYQDPCSNYKTLYAADRLTSYTSQSSVRCDKYDITPGWYRFVSSYGYGYPKMPTHCPSMNRCRTHAPGWMNGYHPSVADGVVTRTVCYHWSNNCCQWKNNIKVKNCGAFYVYELQKTPACYLRYCAEP
ncbi:uncharacterized protein LOC110048345 isoform X2 [Orbicella faveolata]|uniref:uncharacterized protein LOC110048345 isoform X2 n=1 Tax=Orbicella faveolata TaxID=48498 RepID=UPI0009E5ED61|nr:uncharacterized protein LOC110048345 isoform X2 [Orbicella faveolata]